MLQLYLSDQQFYCLPRCDLYWRFDINTGLPMIRYSHGHLIFTIFPYIVQHHSNALNFLENPHRACPLGRGMGCLLWVDTLIYIMPRELQRCMQYHDVCSITSVDLVDTFSRHFSNADLALKLGFDKGRRLPPVFFSINMRNLNNWNCLPDNWCVFPQSSHIACIWWDRIAVIMW